MHYLLFYDTASDYLDRRAEFRSSHLNLAWEYCERGELVLGGALEDPVDGAVLLFAGDSSEIVERFVPEDPYIVNGLVTSSRIRPWTRVVGNSASTPVKP